MGWDQVLTWIVAALSLLLLVALARPLWQRRREPAAAVLLAFLILVGIGVLCKLGEEAARALYLSYSEARLLSWEQAFEKLRPLGIASLLLSTAFWLHFSLEFPTRRPLLERLRWLPAVFYGPVGAMAALILSTPFLPARMRQATSLPAGIAGHVMLATAVVASVGGLACLFLSFLHARTRSTRTLLRTLLIGTAFSAALSLGTYLVPLWAGWPVPMWRFGFLEPLVLFILLGTVVSVVVQYQLFNLRLSVSRGLAYSLFLLGVLCLYVLLVILLTRSIGRAIRPDDPFFLALFTIVVTLCLHPLRLSVQRWLDWLFYRQRYDYRRVMHEFSQDLTQLRGLAVLMRIILDRVVNTWKLRSAALVVREEEDYQVREIHGLLANCLAISFPAGSEAVQYLSTQHQPMDGQAEWFRQLPEHDREALRCLQGELVVPLWVKDEMIGWVQLGEKMSGRPYTQEDVELLSILADQAGAALGNALLHERRRHEVVALEVINRIGLAAASLDLGDLLEGIHQEVALLADAPNLSIVLRDMEEGEWSYLLCVEGGVRQWSREGRRWSPEHTLAGEVIRTGKPIVARDYAEECQRRGISSGEARPGEDGLAWLGVPLLTGSHVLGVLWISSPRETAVYRAEHVRSLSTIASQAAVVVERARSREREEQRVAELETLNEIAQGLSSSIHLEEILRAIYRSVQRVIPAPNFCVALYDQAHDEFALALHIEQGQVIEVTAGQRLPCEGLAGEIVRQRQAIVTDDYQAECSQRGVPTAGLPGRAWLGVPMIVGENAVGIMAASTDEEGRSYTREEVRLFSTIAAQVAGALQNARHYQESRRRIEELAALLQLGTTIASTLDLREMLDTVCHETVQLLKATSAYICLWSEEERASTVIAEYIGPEAAPEERVSDLGVTYSASPQTVEWIRRGEPGVWQASDPEVPPELREHLTQYGGKSVLFLPLVARGQASGFIEVWESRCEREFTEDEILLGRNLAGQAAIAIENARLYQRTDAALTRRVEELTMVEEISRELSVSLDLHHVIEVLVDHAMTATGAAAGLVAMVTPDEQGLLMLTYRGFPAEVAETVRTVPWSVEKGIIGRVVRTNQPVLLADVHEAPDYVSVRPSSRSELAVPIRYGEQPIGVINLESDQPAAFDQEHLRFVNHLAEHAAIAIRNARLFGERERRITELSILNEISRSLASPMGLDELLEMVCRQVSRLFDTTNFFIALFDQPSDEWTTQFEIDRGQRLPPARYKADQGLTGHVIRTRQPILLRSLEECYAMDRQIEAPPLGEAALSWLGVPLIAADKVVGVMAIQSYEKENLYNEQDLALFSTIATQAAIAIDNARLLQGVTEARDRLQAILDSTYDGIMMLDEEGRVLLANPSIERWVGLLREKIIGHTLVEMVRQSTRNNPEVRRSMLEAIRRSRQALARDPQVLLHGSFENPMGITRSFEWVSHPVLDQQGQRIGRILAVHDVTEAREAERMREDLVSMIVHDLRGPLTALLGSIETLLQWDTGPLSEVQKTLLEVALEGGQRILNMVNTLLDIRRLEAGKMPLQFGPVQLAESARLALSHLEGLAQEHHLAVLVDVSPDLPTVRGDPEKLTRVWENLLHNAIKYSYPGGVIRLGARREGDRIVCMVADHGVGIAKAEQERIFEKFTQGRHPKAPRGTGLGLAFCRLAVEAHRGRIWLESEEGKGSTFYFSLPVWGR